VRSCRDSADGRPSYVRRTLHHPHLPCSGRRSPHRATRPAGPSAAPLQWSGHSEVVILPPHSPKECPTMFSMKVKKAAILAVGPGLLVGAAGLVVRVFPADEKSAKSPLNLDPPAIATDPSVKYDYPIVYVRLLRAQKTKVWAQAGVPLTM